MADDLQREFGLTYGILSKCTLGSMLVDALRLSVSVTSARAPEAPPPVEARQPQTGEPWDGIKYLLDSYPGAVRCRYKGLDEDLLASLSVTFIGLRDAARAALAAPAGAGEREALTDRNSSVEFAVVQDGCEQYSAPTLSEAQGFANANGPWAMSIYEVRRTLISKNGSAAQPHLDHQVDSSSGTAAALGRITLLKGSVVKMGGLPHELLADVESALRNNVLKGQP